MENAKKIGLKETPEKGGGVSTIVFGCAYTDVRLQTREGCEREEKVAKRGPVLKGIRTKTELRRYSPTGEVSGWFYYCTRDTRRVGVGRRFTEIWKRT